VHQALQPVCRNVPVLWGLLLAGSSQSLLCCSLICLCLLVAWLEVGSDEDPGPEVLTGNVTWGDQALKVAEEVPLEEWTCWMDAPDDLDTHQIGSALNLHSISLQQSHKLLSIRPGRMLHLVPAKSVY